MQKSVNSKETNMLLKVGLLEKDLITSFINMKKSPSACKNTTYEWMYEKMNLWTRNNPFESAWLIFVPILIKSVETIFDTV